MNFFVSQSLLTILLKSDSLILHRIFVITLNVLSRVLNRIIIFMLSVSFFTELIVNISVCKNVSLKTILWMFSFIFIQYVKNYFNRFISCTFSVKTWTYFSLFHCSFNVLNCIICFMFFTFTAFKRKALFCLLFYTLYLIIFSFISSEGLNFSSIRY